jgi:hypothetical protein
VATPLGPSGPFPDVPLDRVLDRRWLHYALISRDLELALVSNVAWLGPSPEDPRGQPRSTSILLVHHAAHGWTSSQFNARTHVPLWSAFTRPHPFGRPLPFEIASVDGAPAVALKLWRTSHPCTSQCAPFAPHQHLRWQSESGVAAAGDWRLGDRIFRDVASVGYHERVRGRWGWPELGGWVFGFANDTSGDSLRPPPTAVVFTFISPLQPADATTASFMLWRNGRLRRHFPRRRVSMAVSGLLDRNRVTQVPALANLLGVPPMAPIPRRLMIHAALGDAEVILDFESATAARIVIPSETSIRPFSVHEVVGPCRVEGHVGRETFAFSTHGIAEFAGGAGGD